MSKPGRSLGAFLTATTPSRAQLPAAQQPPTTWGTPFRPAGDAHEPQGWDSQRAVHISTFLFDTEDEAPRGADRDAAGREQTREREPHKAGAAAHTAPPSVRAYGGSYSVAEQLVPGVDTRGSSLNGAQAEAAAGGTAGVLRHSWASEAAADPEADEDDSDDDDDDDAPNFDALLCLTTDHDRGEGAAVTAAADCAEPSPLTEAHAGPGDAYALDQIDEPLEEWSPPPHAASQGDHEAGLDVLNEVGAAPSARRRRRPRSLLHLDSDSSDHGGGGGGTQEDALPCGWADRDAPARGQPPAKRPAARQPLAEVQPVPLRRLKRRREDDEQEGRHHGGGAALPAAAPSQPPKRAAVRGRAIVSDSSSDGASDEDGDVDGEEEEEAIDGDGSGEDEDGIIMWQEPASWSEDEDEDDVAEDQGGGGGGSEDDPIEVLDDDDDDVAVGAGAAPQLALPAWRARLPHFASVGDIEARRFVLDGAPVYIDYRRQFTGASASRLPAGAAGSGPSKKAAAPRKKKADANPDGHWVTEGGWKVFITPSGQRLKGSAAYKAWKKAGGK